MSEKFQSARMALRRRRDMLLREWRHETGLPRRKANKRLRLPGGTLKKYERMSILRVPCYHLAAIAKTYRIPPIAFMEAVEHEIIRSGLRPVNSLNGAIGCESIAGARTARNDSQPEV